MIRHNSPSADPPPPVWPGGTAPAHTVQRAGAEAVFTPHAWVLRAPHSPRAVAEELVALPDGGFQVCSARRHTLSPPSGTFNFVRVHGEAQQARPVWLVPGRRMCNWRAVGRLCRHRPVRPG